MKQGLAMRDQVEQFQEDVERPHEVFTCVWVWGYRQSQMADKGGGGGEGTLDQ